MSDATLIFKDLPGECHICLRPPFAVLDIGAPFSLSPVQFDEMLPGLLDRLAILHAEAFVPGQAADGHRYLFGNSFVSPYSIDLMVSTTNVTPEKFAQDRERIAERLRKSCRDALAEQIDANSQTNEQDEDAPTCPARVQQGPQHPVPYDWQGEACRQFDEEMEQRMGGPYYKAQDLFSRIESAKDRIEDIHWDGRTPSEADKQEEKELQTGIDEAESWLHENVYLNPVIKERMYPVVQNRSINFTDDIVAYLGEMKAQLGARAGQLRAESDAETRGQS